MGLGCLYWTYSLNGFMVWFWIKNYAKKNQKRDEKMMVIRINGVILEDYHQTKLSLRNYDDCDVKVVFQPKNKHLKQMAITLWTVSGVLFAKYTAQAASASIWTEIQPVFNVFQDIAMILGAMAIITGLIVMIFKKQVGWRIASTSGLVILGAFLVPAAVMLVAIVGQMLNETLMGVFQEFNVKNSVKVGG